MSGTPHGEERDHGQFNNGSGTRKGRRRTNPPPAACREGNVGLKTWKQVTVRTGIL